MSPCACCIGCAHYRPTERVWCEREDRDACVNRELWVGEHDGTLYPYKPEMYTKIPGDPREVG